MFIQYNIIQQIMNAQEQENGRVVRQYRMVRIGMGQYSEQCFISVKQLAIVQQCNMVVALVMTTRVHIEKQKQQQKQKQRILLLVYPIEQNRYNNKYRQDREWIGQLDMDGVSVNEQDAFDTNMQLLQVAQSWCIVLVQLNMHNTTTIYTILLSYNNHNNSNNNNSNKIVKMSILDKHVIDTCSIVFVSPHSQYHNYNNNNRHKHILYGIWYQQQQQNIQLILGQFHITISSLQHQQQHQQQQQHRQQTNRSVIGEWQIKCSYQMGEHTSVCISMGLNTIAAIPLHHFELDMHKQCRSLPTWASQSLLTHRYITMPMPTRTHTYITTYQFHTTHDHILETAHMKCMGLYSMSGVSEWVVVAHVEVLLDAASTDAIYVLNRRHLQILYSYHIANLYSNHPKCRIVCAPNYTLLIRCGSRIYVVTQSGHLIHTYNGCGTYSSHTIINCNYSNSNSNIVGMGVDDTIYIIKYNPQTQHKYQHMQQQKQQKQDDNYKIYMAM